MTKLLVLFCAIIPYMCTAMNNHYMPPPYIAIADEITNDVAKTLCQKYSMRVVGIKGGMAGAVNVVGLHFQIQGPLTQERLREILIDSEEKFLTAINTNEEIRPYLKQFPFTTNELEIVIFVVDSQGREIFHPSINVVSVYSGKVVYHTLDQDDPYQYKTEIIEKYEDDLAIVKAGQKQGIDRLPEKSD